MSRKLVLATRNPGKIREICQLLKGLPVDILTVEDFPALPEVEETGTTLEENALLKATHIHQATRLPVLADDTGLEVEALGGKPGVYSARFAGKNATDAENRRYLLDALAGQSNRKAQFRTVVVFMEDEKPYYFEGVCRGEIITEERGAGGFGYDPIFVPEGKDRTFAELSAAEKNAISHRGKALNAFRAFLEHYWKV